MAENGGMTDPRTTDFSSDDVEKVLIQFYSGSSGQTETNRWLTLVQLSHRAWTICWDLLQPNKPWYVQYFGASCLYTKISKFWPELPKEEYKPMREKIMVAILNSAISGPQYVLTRLCVAISSYVIYTINESWTTAIPDIIHNFDPSRIAALPPDRTFRVLLEIITVLPEEFQTMNVPLAYRGRVRTQLWNSLSHIMPILLAALTQSHSAEVQLQGLRCCNSWVQFGIPIPDCGSLLSAVLACLHQSPDGDGQESILEIITNVAQHPDLHHHPSFLMSLLDQIVRLETFVQNAKEENDVSQCYRFYMMFNTVAECHCRFFLKVMVQNEEVKNNFLKLVHMILECSNFPGQYPTDEVCSCIPFAFWYSLQDDLMSGLDSSKAREYTEYFVPVYENLVDVLLRKAMYPESEEYHTWTPDEQDQFRCYRQEIGDTLMYCHSLLQDQMLNRLMHHLVHVAANQFNQWRVLESCLFAVRSVAENLEASEDKFLPNFFAIFCSLPLSNHKILMSTALETLGAYSEWINRHPATLGQLLPIVLMGLEWLDVTPHATLALKIITRDCQCYLHPYAKEILQVVQKVLTSAMLRNEEQLKLMCSIGYVLSVLPFRTIIDYLNDLLEPIIKDMESLNQDSANGCATIMQLQLCKLTTLCASLDTKLQYSSADDDGPDSASGHQRQETLDESGLPQPIFLVLKKVLPLLRDVGVCWSSSLAIVEVICKLLKASVSTLLDDCAPLLLEIVDLLLFLYRVHPNVEALNLMKQFLLLFGKDVKQKQIMKEALANVIGLTLELCNKGISNYTDVVEAFLSLLAQLIKKNCAFLQDDRFNLTDLFQCGTLALAVPEAPTVKAAAFFMVNFVMHSRENPAMMDVVNKNGEALVGQILQCIGGISPRGVMDNMADILLALNKKYFDNLCRWMNTFLNQDNFPSHQVTRDQKEHFIRLVLKERANKCNLQETVKSFTLICRGIYGTEYAAHIMLSL